MKKSPFLRVASVLWAAAVLSLAFYGVTLARYVARADVNAAAQIAGFDVQSTPVNFGTNRMVYLHRRTRSHMGRPTGHYQLTVASYGAVDPPWQGRGGPGTNLNRSTSPHEYFRIDVTNTSDVAVRMRPEFFNVLDHHARPGARTRVPHHRLGQPTNPYMSHYMPRIVNVRSYPARTAAEGNYGGPNHTADGVFVAPGDTVRFYWELEAHTDRHNVVDKYGNSVVEARGWLNHAFRINYDIIAVQVD